MQGIIQKRRDDENGDGEFVVEFGSNRYPISLRDQSIRDVTEGMTVSFNTDAETGRAVLETPEQVRGVMERV